MCRWIDSLNRFGFRWVSYCWRQGVRRLWAPMKIVLVQQLSGFQRAPQGKELSSTKISIAHIAGSINTQTPFAVRLFLA